MADSNPVFRRAEALKNVIERPEFLLLLACARVQDGSALSEAAARDVDWDVLLQAAERHSIVPLLHRALVQNPGVPLAARERLNSLFGISLRRNLFLTAELIRLIDALTAAGISVLPYKGPALAQALYGDIALRSFTDLDLLVRSHDVRRVLEVLESAGYHPDPLHPAAHRQAHLASASEQMFRSRTSAALVEIQWRIAPRYFSVDFDMEWFWRTSGTVLLETRQVASLAPEAMFLALSVHGAKHQWERLVWIADIAQLLCCYPDLDWESTLLIARKLGIQRFVLLALALAQRLLGAELPGCLHARLPSDHTVPWLCLAVERRLVEDARGLPSLAGHCFTLRARERWRDRVRYVSRLALTPNPQDWAMLPLPQTLSPLYLGIRALRLMVRLARAGWQRVLHPATAPGHAGDGS